MAKRFTARPRVGGRRAVVRRRWRRCGPRPCTVGPWPTPYGGGRSRPPPGGGRVVDWWRDGLGSLLVDAARAPRAGRRREGAEAAPHSGGPRLARGRV